MPEKSPEIQFEKRVGIEKMFNRFIFRHKNLNFSLH